MLFGIVLSSSSCTGNGLDVRIYLAPIPTKLGCRRDGTKKNNNCGSDVPFSLGGLRSFR